MNAFRVARKTLREAWREPKLYGLLMLFPALLVVIYSVAFGQGQSGLSQMLRVMVIDRDDGPAGAQLVAALRAERFAGQPVFDVVMAADRASAEVALRERKAGLLLVLPADFSRALQAGRGGASPAGAATVQMVGDPASDTYVFASGFVSTAIDAFSRRATGWDKPSPLGVEFIRGTGTLSDLQFGIPGVLVFGVLFNTISAAMVLVREEVAGTLRRLKLSRAGGLDIIGGIALAHLVLAAIQVPLAFGVALLFGFKSPGSLLLAIAIGAVLSLAATGLGLLAACFARSDGEAANLGTLLLMPLAFLSGAVFPMPPLPVFTVAGRVIQLYDLLPSAHAAEAMRRVLIFGDGPADVAYSLAGLAVFSLLYLALGVAVYQRRKLRAI
jgi:ABC-2 type transport system permease protein